MANLIITEFDGTALINGVTPIPVASFPALAEQAVPIVASANNLSAAFGPTTRLIRVKAEAACYIKADDPANTPIATALSAKLDDGEREYFYVEPGHKLTVFGG